LRSRLAPGYGVALPAAASNARRAFRCGALAPDTISELIDENLAFGFILFLAEDTRIQQLLQR